VTRIKLSGLKQPADAQLAVRLGVDMVACVFNAQSPRYVTAQQAWAIRRVISPPVAMVGVFVNTPPPIVQQVALSCQLDYVQLFGDEPRADLEALGAAAFKAVTVTDAPALETALRTFVGRWSRRGDTPALLVHLSGGLGQAWDLLAGPAARAPLALAASALGADTAAEAIRIVRPWAVDVWDAVESEPGHLDPALLAQFIAAVRDADASSASAGKETRP
jgi:phosphoribosylanthranilate isomerase